ncbi:MAG: mechanosensitive ion channel [Hyphomonadaceae bacterium]|nr:mechanosensitive ion channel [Hyphomonadaceae bacterium]
MTRFVLRYLRVVFATALLIIMTTAAVFAQSWDEIERELESLQTVSGLSEEEQLRVDAILEEVTSEVEAAQQLVQRVETFVEQRSNRSEIVADLNARLAALQAEDQLLDLPETSRALQDRLSVVESERRSLAEARDALLDERVALSTRVSEIAEELAAAREALTDLVETTTEQEQNPSVEERAAALLVRARTLARRTEISELQRELQTVPDRQSIVSARIAVANEEIGALDEEIALIQRQLSDVRMDRAEAALDRATRNAIAAQGMTDMEALAQANIDLAETLKSLAETALSVEQDIKQSSQQTLQIRQQSDTVERILATGRVTNEVGDLLRQLRMSLPNAQSLRVALNETVEARTSIQLNLILWQDELRIAGDQDLDEYLNSQVDAEPDEVDMEPNGQVEVSIADLTEHRQQLLTSLLTAGRSQLDRLTDKEIAVRETLTETQSLRQTLDRRLLWLPSNVPALTGWPGKVASSVAWMSSPGLIPSVPSSYQQIMLSYPFWWLVPLAFAGALIFFRTRLSTTLSDLNDSVGKIPRDRYATTPSAFLVCFALALPVPLLLSAIALPIFRAGNENAFATALAAGICGAAITLLIVKVLEILSREGGVFQTHFDWNDRALRAVRRMPFWMICLLIVSVFVFTASHATYRPDVQHGLGLPAFCVASLIIALVGYIVFQFDRGVVEEVISEGMNDGILFLGMLVFALTPGIVGLIPLLGYYDTAVALQGRVLQSAILLLGLALLFGILRRLFLVAQRRLALRRAAELRAQRAAERAEREERGEEDHKDDEFSEMKSESETLVAERERISEQTRRLLLYATGVAAIAGILAVWAAVLPALGIANDITLWTGSQVVDGVRTSRPVTLWNLFLFFAFIAAGIVAAYNIRGALEIGPFQRLKLSPGSRYAIDTIIGYFLVGAGIVAGFLQLGVDWSRLQWIIAALGVGLGFGLQEIVANFISGLIILFERPVRVGDTVTIGELEGTVTNVAIRATTVKDFDNREVLLPNKTIITENVTNWTLRDSIMRIIVPIGVAYGSDVVAVRDLLLKIAQDEDDVLESPEPKVFFMNHGDSSLDFEVRVFISNPRKRFRVRHELNLAINSALNEAGIEIPFPQRDVHMKS